jgi:hypothetical protein
MKRAASDSEYDTFNSAMGKILRADPAKVKAQMEAEKKEREEKRKVRKQSSASDHASGDRGA